MHKFRLLRPAEKGRARVMGSSNDESADLIREMRIRRRVASFIDDPTAVEGATPAEIRLAVKSAIREMIALQDGKDDAKLN